MDHRTNQILFALLRSAIKGYSESETDRKAISPPSEEELIECYKLAKTHDLQHLVAYAIQQNGLLERKVPVIENAVMTAFYRYEQMNYELLRLCEFFESEKIDFLPLKGSVLRGYYPEPWMRTSCDIDILIDEKDLDRARDLLVEKRGYEYRAKGDHDISLYLDDSIHLELHYTLITDGVARQSSDVLRDIRQYAATKDGYAHLLELSDDAFYFYHVAHMAKHFEQGGCGVRPMIDLYILDTMSDFDADKRDALLQKGGLDKFAEVARKLSRVWMNGEEHDEISQKAENYLLAGGVYGNLQNAVTVQQQKKGGRFRYALSKIIIPYDVIKFQYPILQKHRRLTPLMQVRRWFKLIFCGHAKRSLHQLKLNQSLSKEEATATKAFLDDIGLS